MWDIKLIDMVLDLEKQRGFCFCFPFCCCCCLDMANWFSTELPEDAAAWTQSHTHCQPAALNVDDAPFLHPQLSPGEASSFDFSAYSSSFPCPWAVPIEGLMEARAPSSSRSHSEAEKRRRDRINAQLATLRKLIPKSEKMDKAALLGSVVDHVRDLKRKATEISKVIMIPTDVDEVTVDYINEDDARSCGRGSEENIFLKASVCCDDRPELLSELNRALKNLRLSTVGADIVSLGGRMRSIFTLCFQANNNEEEGRVCMNTVKQSLKVVLNRIATSGSASNCRIKSRRQRFFWPSR